MSDDDEVERLKRLREKQVKGRDPRKMDQKLHSEISRKIKKSQKVTAGQVIDEMPAKWLYMIVGFVIGLILGLLLIALFPGALWAQLVALVVLLFLTLTGRVAGMAEDWRKKL